MKILPIKNINFKSNSVEKTSKKSEAGESYTEKERKAEERREEELKRKQEEWITLIHRPQTYSNTDK